MTLFFVQCVEKSLRWGNIFFYLFVKDVLFDIVT